MIRVKTEMETGAYTFKIVITHKVHGLPWPPKASLPAQTGHGDRRGRYKRILLPTIMTPASSKGRGRRRGEGRKRGEKEENKSHPLGLKLI